MKTCTAHLPLETGHSVHDFHVFVFNYLAATSTSCTSKRWW